MTLNLGFKITRYHAVTVNALDVLCAQLTRDLFAIAKFLYKVLFTDYIFYCRWYASALNR